MAVTRLLLPTHASRLPNQRDTTPDDGESWKAAGEKINNTMARSGQATIDFGAIPGASDTTLASPGKMTSRPALRSRRSSSRRQPPIIRRMNTSSIRPASAPA
jgi:hypothetical protein